MVAPDGLAIREGETRRAPAARSPRPERGAMDWDGVRVFLAVVRGGSMRAAGRALGLSQPTIARRLAAFEAAFGGPSCVGVNDLLYSRVDLAPANEGYLLLELELIEPSLFLVHAPNAAESFAAALLSS